MSVGHLRSLSFVYSSSLKTPTRQCCLDHPCWPHLCPYAMLALSAPPSGYAPPPYWLVRAALVGLCHACQNKSEVDEMV
jgi:hypothetical protein